MGCLCPRSQSCILLCRASSTGLSTRCYGITKELATKHLTVETVGVLVRDHLPIHSRLLVDLMECTRIIAAASAAFSSRPYRAQCDEFQYYCCSTALVRPKEQVKKNCVRIFSINLNSSPDTYNSLVTFSSVSSVLSSSPHNKCIHLKWQ